MSSENPPHPAPLNDEPQRGNQAEDEFLATLSHELRTPLASILLHAQRLRVGDLVDPCALQSVGAALERAAWTQARLIDDLLDVSRVVVGTLGLDCALVDLCSIVEAALEDVGPLMAGQALALELSLGTDMRPIWADRTRVEQVVSKLLTNAIKFTPPGGRVTVAVDAEAGFARLRVTDTGIGIEPEFLAHVFTRFAQHDSSTTRSYAGLGLGLSLVRHLTEMHGGAVRAESGGRGQGATLLITLPFAQAQEAVDGSVKARRTGTREPREDVQRHRVLLDLRVLVVDDDEAIREAVCEVLQYAGARVSLAASALEGMVAIDDFQPQVIVCDIAMPVEDGYAFIRKLRAKESGQGTAATPALALTALATEDDRRRAEDAGFQLHVAKPVDMARLTSAVRRLSELAQSSSGGQAQSSPVGA